MGFVLRRGERRGFWQGFGGCPQRAMGDVAAVVDGQRVSDGPLREGIEGMSWGFGWPECAAGYTGRAPCRGGRSAVTRGFAACVS
jgi:hypothetical protein